MRAIDTVYTLLPPDEGEIPNRDDVLDATLAIHAFIMNAFGCLDNIAWIWVYEKDLKNEDGTELEVKDVGLGKKKVRRQVTDEFRAFLDDKKDWFTDLIEFRHSLAHRIPLYIPPYVVPTKNAEKYQQLEQKKWEEPARHDSVVYAQIKAEQMSLCHFVPGMTHSIFEEAPTVEFHSRLLTDYLMIGEHCQTLLTELER